MKNFNDLPAFATMYGNMLSTICARGEFVLDPHNEETVRRILLYFAGSPRSPWPLDRGLYLWGKVGTGKTLLMEAMRLILSTLRAPGVFKLRTAAALSDAYALGGAEIYADFAAADLCIDDVGNEPRETNYFGTRVELIPVLIERRYAAWQLERRRTHFTSNFDLEWITEHYGRREVSRLTEMVTVVEVTAPGDRRII